MGFAFPNFVGLFPLVGLGISLVMLLLLLLVTGAPFGGSMVACFESVVAVTGLSTDASAESCSVIFSR